MPCNKQIILIFHYLFYFVLFSKMKAWLRTCCGGGGNLFFPLTDCQLEQFVPVGSSTLYAVVPCYKVWRDILIMSGVAADIWIWFIYLLGNCRWSSLPFIAFGINPFPELLELTSLLFLVHLSPLAEKTADFPSTFALRSYGRCLIELPVQG